MDNYKKELDELIETVIKEGASDLHLSEGRLPTLRVTGNLIPLAKKQIFRTVTCRIKFWHKHMREYAKAMADILTDYHALMQLQCQLQEAEKSHDFERALHIRREIRKQEKKQDRK